MTREYLKHKESLTLKCFIEFGVKNFLCRFQKHLNDTLHTASDKDKHLNNTTVSDMQSLGDEISSDISILEDQIRMVNLDKWIWRPVPSINVLDFRGKQTMLEETINIIRLYDRLINTLKWVEINKVGAEGFSLNHANWWMETITRRYFNWFERVEKDCWVILQEKGLPMDPPNLFKLDSQGSDLKWFLEKGNHQNFEDEVLKIIMGLMRKSGTIVGPEVAKTTQNETRSNFL